MNSGIRLVATGLFAVCIALLTVGCDDSLVQRAARRPTETSQTHLPGGIPATPAVPGIRDNMLPEQPGKGPFSDGQVFIVDASSRSFLTISPQTGEEIARGLVDPKCGIVPIPRSTSVVCREADRLFTVDILDGKSRDLGIDAQGYFDWDPTGRYLMYVAQANGTALVHALSLTSNITTTYPIGSVDEQYRRIGPPKLSPSGKKLLIARTADVPPPPAARVYVVDSANAGLTPLTPVGQWLTWDLEWSPQGDSFVYGVTDLVQEIGPRPNMVYRYDIDRNLATLLVRAPEGDSFESWSLEYSPLGDKFFVALVSGAVCVVDAHSPALDCISAHTDARGRYAAWSPDGTRFALVDVQRQLVVINTQSRVKTIIRTVVPDKFALFWR